MSGGTPPSLGYTPLELAHYKLRKMCIGLQVLIAYSSTYSCTLLGLRFSPAYETHIVAHIIYHAMPAVMERQMTLEFLKYIFFR